MGVGGGAVGGGSEVGFCRTRTRTISCDFQPEPSESIRISALKSGDDDRIKWVGSGNKSWVKKSQCINVSWTGSSNPIAGMGWAGDLMDGF